MTIDRWLSNSLLLLLWGFILKYLFLKLGISGTISGDWWSFEWLLFFSLNDFYILLALTLSLTLALSLNWFSCLNQIGERMCSELLVITESVSLHDAFIHTWLIKDFFIKVGLHSCSTVAIFFIKSFILRLLIIVFNNLILILVETIIGWSLFKLFRLLCSWINLFNIIDDDVFILIFESIYHFVLMCVLHEFCVVEALSLFDLLSRNLRLVILFLSFDQRIRVLIKI
jgi:hypothetical protein